LAPAAARAQPERYFVDEGFHPEGFTFGLMLQGGGFISTSCCNIGGRRGAGGGGIRIGTAATPDAIVMLQLEAATVPIENTAGTIKANTHSTLTVGAQYFVRGSFWVQGGLGLGTYRITQTVERTMVEDLERTGFAFSTAVGFDLVRRANAWSFGFARQDLALSYEIRISGALYPGGEVMVGGEQDTGAIMQFTTGLGLQWY
jgi:hypothetical protein